MFYSVCSGSSEKAIFSALVRPIYFSLCSEGEQYGEEFGKVSIIRKVPVLKDGDFILTERYVVTLIYI